MKACLVTNFPFYSGTGEVLFKIWREFKKQSPFQADLYLTHFLKEVEKEMPENKGVKVLHPFSYDKNPLLSRFLIYFLDPYLLPKDYDVYHFGNHMIARFATIRRPSVVTVHDVLQFKYPEVFESKMTSKIYNYFMEKSIKSLPEADHLICVSHWSKKELLSIFKEIDPRRVSVVYNGLDHAVFYPRSKEAARKKLGWDPNNKYLLHLGSEIKRKQVPLLIKSFKIIKQLFPETVLVRHGEEKESTKRLIQDLGLEKEVVYYGYTRENDLPDFYSAADLLVQPSSEEGFCFPVIEAMACGLPVVSSNRASLPEVCGQAEAAVMENLTEESVANSVARALRMGEAERDVVIKKGIINSQRFSWAKTSQAVFEIYQKVVRT